ncbi:tRNA (guanine-N(7)-)-methyltransferase non-catalytic subunit wuho [Anopheles nili]|uniref:tRNA (guanine-N(7)-)-methyltransferase non-catalytic subunit wuho n=1 Tax=Anopheles nili TaxID=185578 RepID=UPI00237ADF4C|nr:tRNA (guanine-N(7)-)-methyltransferase non-catalytic subunit wuho [Anopheles nili]
MYDLKTYPGFTVVGIRDRIVFFSAAGAVLHEIAIPQKVVADGANANGERNTSNQPQQPAHVVALEYCPNVKVLAVSLSDKSLRCYQLTLDQNDLRSTPLGDRIETARTIVCMKFAPKRGILFGSDKSDCFEYDVFGKSDQQSKWILGHTSQILCLNVSEDERFIVTSDRDEKIKISCYPDCHNIECYCLGHLEYVAGLEMVTPQNLLSVSGDKTLRLWDYTEGKQIFCHNLDFPAVGMVTQPMTDGSGMLCAVKSFVGNKIEVAHVSSNKCVTFDPVTVDESLTILSAALTGTLELILLAIERENMLPKIMVFNFVNDKKQFVQCTEHALSLNFEKSFQKVTIDDVKDYTTLFKHSIDNLTEYYEKKKQKIESKKSK